MSKTDNTIKYLNVPVVWTPNIKAIITERPDMKQPLVEKIIEGSKMHLRLIDGMGALDAHIACRMLAMSLMRAAVAEGQGTHCEGCRTGECCSVEVTLSQPEFEALMMVVKRDNIELDMGLLRRQSSKKFDALPAEDRKCIFLKGGECSIYSMRPINCIKYYVSSHVEYNCDKHDEQTAFIVSLAAEIAVSAMMTACHSRNIRIGTLGEFLAEHYGIKQK